MKLPITISFLVLALVAGHKILPVPDSSSFSKDSFWTKKVFGSNENSVVVYGDSRVYRGISIQEFIGNNMEYKGVNLGFNSSGVNDGIFELIDKKLNSENSTKIIVLGITPNLFTNLASKNSHYDEIKNLAYSEVLLRLTIYPYLTPYDRRTPLDVYYSLRNSKNRYQYFETFHENGWVESITIPIDTNAACESYKNEFLKGKSLEKNQTALLNQILVWKKKGIEVFAFQPPISGSLENVEDEYSDFKYDPFVSHFEKNGGVWIDLPKNKWATYDGSHLIGKEAKKFSRYLGSIIFNKSGA